LHQIEARALKNQIFLTSNAGCVLNENSLNMGKEYVVYIGHQVGLEIILTKCEDAKL
jgi:hypothetical protein